MRKTGTEVLENRFDSLKASMRDLVDASGDRAEKIKSKAVDLKDAVVENSSAALNKAGSFIKEHPIAAIGIAFGIGYVAMRMLKK